jgi:hypothetical protein
LAKPNGDLDFLSKYIIMNALSIRGVYGLFLERIYHKMYIAKFTHTSLESQIWRKCPGLSYTRFLKENSGMAF